MASDTRWPAAQRPATCSNATPGLDADRRVLERSGHDVRLWTWAGPQGQRDPPCRRGSPEGQSDNDAMILRDLDDPDRTRLAELGDVVPVVPLEMSDSLKFSAALPDGSG